MTEHAQQTDWKAEFEGVSTGTIASLLVRRGYPRQFVAGLNRYGSGRSTAAPAWTLRLVPTRPDLADRTGSDPFRDVVETAPEGHLLVIDSGGVTGCGVIGDMLATRLAARGVRGIVTDGAVRDAQGIAPLSFAVHAAGTNGSLRSLSLTVGSLQEPVVCRGVTVLPGDVLVADEDGVIAVPAHLAAEVARLGRDQEDLEEYLAIRLRAGEPLDGLYPPNEANRAAYATWRADRQASGAQHATTGEAR